MTTRPCGLRRAGNNYYVICTLTDSSIVEMLTEQSDDAMEPGLVAFTTSGQERNRTYSLIHGAAEGRLIEDFPAARVSYNCSAQHDQNESL